MDKHTPGPWEVGPMETDVRTFSYRNEPCSVICNLSSDIVDPDEARANARLIASAPEMLAALKLAEEVIKAQNDGNCLAAVLDAIAKADGESK